ncbi:MAG: hypothetical protein J6X44_00105 [Thermoguttaceae bacterium]|nr:hypothetical protein [Thermoguttaceae bacterium]
MKVLFKRVFAIVLTLIGGFSFDNFAYCQSKEATIIENAYVDNPDLKLTLEIYPTEIYFGDVVYFAAYYNNVSDKSSVNCIDHGNLPAFINYPGCVKISSPQLEREYLWRPENTSGGIPSLMTTYASIPPGKRRPAGSADVELPPLEDWNDPFWKELREKMTPDGIVCQFQITQRLGIRQDAKNVVFTQDILIKPRPEEETALLDKWFHDTPEDYFPKQSELTKRSNIFPSKKYDGDSVVINGEEYKLWPFVRSIAFKKPFIPNFPTSLEGWRALDSKFCDSTLHDDIKYTCLMLEFFEADSDRTEQAKNDLTDWLETLPDVQRSFFMIRLLNEGYSFQNTPLADKYRVLGEHYHLPKDFLPL